MTLNPTQSAFVSWMTLNFMILYRSGAPNPCQFCHNSWIFEWISTLCDYCFRIKAFFRSYGSHYQLWFSRPKIILFTFFAWIEPNTRSISESFVLNLSICLSAKLSVCLPVTICLSSCLSAYLRLYLSVYPSACLSMSVCVPICLSFTSLNSLLFGKTHPDHLNSPDQLWPNNETPPVSAEALYAAVCGFHAVRAKLCAPFKCAVVSALMEHHSSHAAGQDEDAVLRGTFLPPRSNPGLVLSETHKCWEVTRVYRCK